MLTRWLIAGMIATSQLSAQMPAPLPGLSKLLRCSDQEQIQFVEGQLNAGAPEAASAAIRGLAQAKSDLILPVFERFVLKWIEDGRPEERGKAMSAIAWDIPQNLAGFRLIERLAKVDPKIGNLAARYCSAVLYAALESPVKGIRELCAAEIGKEMLRPFGPAHAWGRAMVDRYGGKPTAIQLKTDSVARVVVEGQLQEALRLAFKSADELIADKSKPVPWELPESVQKTWLQQNFPISNGKGGADIDTKDLMSFIKRRSDLAVPFFERKIIAAISSENREEARNYATMLLMPGDTLSLLATDRIVSRKPEWFQVHVYLSMLAAWGDWNIAGRTGDPHPAWKWALEGSGPEFRALTKMFLKGMGTANGYDKRQLAAMFAVHYKHPPTTEELKADSVWQAILKGATPEWQKNVVVLMQTE